MKIPSSFSLLTLLLLTTIVAMAFAVYSTRSELLQSEMLNEKLVQQTGFIELADPTQLHIRKLQYNVPLTFSFQVYAPPGHSYALNIGEGIVGNESGYPPLIISGKILGEGNQGTVILNLHRIGSGWVLGDFGELSDTGNVFCDGGERFQWLALSLGKSFHSISRQNHGSLETFDASSSVILFQQSENDGIAITSMVNDEVVNPRLFMIWLEPIGK